MSQAGLRRAAGLEGSDGKNLTPMQTVQHYFVQHKNQIEAALPKHLTADRMCRLAMTAMSQNRALMDCDAKSIFGAVITASQLGLEIGVLGQAYLVPYKGKATLVPGWQGLCDLVGRAGRASVWTGAVFEGDAFEYQLGADPVIRHRPGDEDDPKRLTHVYAVGRVNGSQWPVIEVWTMAKVWKHRDRYNKVGTRHYSYEQPEMYARKVVLLQVMKYMPKSVEITAAIDLSNHVDEGRSASLDADFMVIDQEDMAAINVNQPSDQFPRKSSKAALLDKVAAATTVEDLDLIASLAKELSAEDAKEVHAEIAMAVKAMKD